MEKSKARPVSNTVVFSLIFLSIAVCFSAMIHVELELHAHRQMLQVLNEREETFEPRKTLHEETMASLLKMLQGDCGDSTADLNNGELIEHGHYTALLILRFSTTCDWNDNIV